MALSVVVTMVFFLFRSPDPTVLHGEMLAFVEILPAELTEAQRVEITGILARYQQSVMAGEVHPERQREISASIELYVSNRSIKMDDLYDFMAEVSTSTYDIDTMHPLLESDSTTAQ